MDAELNPLRRQRRVPTSRQPIASYRFRALVTIGLLMAATVIGLGVREAGAQDNAGGKVLRVAVKPIEPFVFKRGTELTGFSIDLWNAIAQSLKVETTWVDVSTVGEQLHAVESGKADVAIAAITITKERENVVDFTQPYFDSGLQIVVQGKSSNRLLDVLDSIPWSTIGILLGIFIAIMVVMAHILWVVERSTSEHFRKGYLRSMGEGLWGIALIVATGEHGDRQTCKIVKRFIVFFMWLVGVVLIAQLTATISSTQTVERLNSSIRGPGDLPGKKVATVRGTFPADYLTEQGVRYVEVGSAEEGCDLVAKGEVQAMVFDAPTLQYLVANRWNGVLRVVGPIFAPQKYGLAVADGSPLRKRIDRALLEMYEDGRYKALYNKWFSHE